MVLINQRESEILNKEYGIKFGYNGISHTYSKHKKYYLCESKENMYALTCLRNKQLGLPEPQLPKEQKRKRYYKNKK